MAHDLDAMHPVERDGQVIGYALTAEDARLFEAADDLHGICLRLSMYPLNFDPTPEEEIKLPPDLWDEIAKATAKARGVGL